MAAEATELECLNRILIGALSHPAAATTDTRPDVQNALQILRETDRALQSTGHYFNTEYNQTLTEAASRIAVTTDMYSVDESSGSDKPGTVYPNTESYSLRYDGGTRYVYDNNKNTFDFAADVVVNIVRRIPFEELPQVVRDYITAMAASEFYEIARGQRSAKLEERSQMARVAFLQDEQDQGDFSTFTNPHDAWVHRNR